MPANTSPIYTLTPNVGPILIPTTNAQVKSDGTSAGSGTDLMYKAWTAGANGSFLDRIRFFPVANSAATNSIATVLRAYLSTVSSPGATTSSNTFLIGEVSVPIISASHSTNAVNYYEIIAGFAVPTGYYVHVSQHVAQTTNQSWLAMAMGGDY